MNRSQTLGRSESENQSNNSTESPLRIIPSTSDGAIDTGHAFMRLRDGFQYRRRFFRRVGIERDHHATRIALENGDGYFCADAQRATDEFIFGEAFG